MTEEGQVAEQYVNDLLDERTRRAETGAAIREL